MTSTVTIDNLEKRCKKPQTAAMYRRAIEIHLPKDYSDFTNAEAVEKHLDEKGATLSNKIIVYKALCHVCAYDETSFLTYKQRLMLLNEQYAAQRMEQSTVPENIDKEWANVLEAIDKNNDGGGGTSTFGLLWTERKNKEAQMCAKLWALLMSHHPRRFTDWWKLTTTKEEETEGNYVNAETGEVHFVVFKNASSPTAGQTRLKLNEPVAEYLREFIKYWEIDGFVFPQVRRRMYTIINRFKMPTTVNTRKFYENKDLFVNNKGVLETAQRFNHSVATQAVYYRRPPAVADPAAAQ
jgi:hypothetical protein